MHTYIHTYIIISIRSWSMGQEVVTQSPMVHSDSNKVEPNGHLDIPASF